MTAKQKAKFVTVLENRHKFNKFELNEIDIIQTDFANEDLWPGWVEILDELYETALSPIETPKPIPDGTIIDGEVHMAPAQEPALEEVVI